MTLESVTLPHTDCTAGCAVCGERESWCVEAEPKTVPLMWECTECGTVVHDMCRPSDHTDHDGGWWVEVGFEVECPVFGDLDPECN